MHGLLLSIYIKMGAQMFVGMWRDNGNPSPYTDLDEILHPHPHLSKEGFGACLKLKETFLKAVYKAKDVQKVAN